MTLFSFMLESGAHTRRSARSQATRFGDTTALFGAPAGGWWNRNSEVAAAAGSLKPIEPEPGAVAGSPDAVQKYATDRRWAVKMVGRRPLLFKALGGGYRLLHRRYVVSHRPSVGADRWLAERRRRPLAMAGARPPAADVRDRHRGCVPTCQEPPKSPRVSAPSPEAAIRVQV